MCRYVNWVEAEHAGEFDVLDDALKEAAVTAFCRLAEVSVTDELTGVEWLVDVHEQKPRLNAHTHGT